MPFFLYKELYCSLFWHRFYLVSFCETYLNKCYIHVIFRLRCVNCCQSRLFDLFNVPKWRFIPLLRVLPGVLRRLLLPAHLPHGWKVPGPSPPHPPEVASRLRGFSPGTADVLPKIRSLFMGLLVGQLGLWDSNQRVPPAQIR